MHESGLGGDDRRRVGAIRVRALGCAGALALLTVGACAGEGGNAIAPGGASARVASLTLRDVPATILAGDTVSLVAEARDAAGRPRHGTAIAWATSNPALATIAPDGRLVGMGHGTVSVTAAAGEARAAAEVAVRLTSEERRLAYAWVDDPAAGAPTTPATAYRHNETGGGVRVSRIARGRHRVSFERMAKVDSAFRETVLVTPYGASGERCHLDGWGNSPNARDLDVVVSCYAFDGSSIDAPFSVLVVGSRSLPSRMGFTVAGDASAQFAPQPGHTFSSFTSGVAISRPTAGSYLVQLNGAAGDSPQSYFVSTYGSAAELCKVSSWNRDVWAGVICYAPSGVLADSRFSILMLESGRPGKRFGFAWADQPAVPAGTSYTPHLPTQRTSSGAPVRITRSAVGTYVVAFPGLAKHGSHPETVHVSPYGGGLLSCQVQGWGNDAEGTSLEATVRCWDRGSGQPADSHFTILVLE